MKIYIADGFVMTKENTKLKMKQNCSDSIIIIEVFPFKSGIESLNNIQQNSCIRHLMTHGGVGMEGSKELF